MKIEPQTIRIDSKTYSIALDRSGIPVWEVRSGERLEKEFVFGGAMGETRCIHEGICNGYYFANGFDVTDGTARLHPGITTVGARYTKIGTVGGTTTTLTDSTGGFPTTGDGLKNYTVTITGGTGVGQARTITSNTATQVTVATWTAPDSTSTYDISVLGSLAYTPLSLFEDFDSTATRAVYLLHRDCTTTPDVIAKKIRPSDDTPIDVKNFGASSLTAPRIGRAEAFGGATYVPTGDEIGGLLLQKLATVGAIATEVADTWESADAGVFASSCATIIDGAVSKFIQCTDNGISLTSSEPKTLANYEARQYVGDSTDVIIWFTEMSDGLVAVHLTRNLALWDSEGNTYTVLPGNRRTAKQLSAAESSTGNSYDDYDGHMGAPLSAGVVHPARDGFWFYQNGRIQNASIDQIGQGTQNPYRRVPNISNIPFGNRHYATVVFNQWVYSIYKPTGFSNTANIHIMCGYYENGEITWRTLLTQTKDIIGLFIDSGMRLWWVFDPQDPATIPGTPTADLKYITLNADGSPRTTLGGTATYPRGAASTTYSYHFPEIDFGLPYVQKQLLLMTLETENLPTAGAAGVSITLTGYRDEVVSPTLGMDVIETGSMVERSPVMGTYDAFYRIRPVLTLTTGASYAPTTSDPRLMRLKVEARSADMIRTVLLPTAQRNLFETKKILRKLKSAGVKTVREPDTNETFSAKIVAVNDTVHEGKRAVECIMERWSVNA